MGLRLRRLSTVRLWLGCLDCRVVCRLALSGLGLAVIVPLLTLLMLRLLSLTPVLPAIVLALVLRSVLCTGMRLTAPSA